MFGIPSNSWWARNPRSDLLDLPPFQKAAHLGPIDQGGSGRLHELDAQYETAERESHL